MVNLLKKIINYCYIHFHPFYKSSYFLYKRLTDKKEISYINKHLKKDMVAIDVGANIGFYTLLMSDLVGKYGKVYSFEPDKTNFQLLKKNIKGRNNIHLFNYAVGDKNGILKLYISKNFNVDHRTYQTEDTRRVQEIRSIKLDDFLKVKQVHFIKIDIQGFDYYAIKGAKNLIKNQKQLHIVGEFWPYGLKMAGIRSKEYILLLKSLGLRIKLHYSKSLKELESNKNFYTNFIASK